MRLARLVGMTALAAVLAGCETTQSRIRRRRAEFDSYPPEIQKMIRDGRVEVGFTQEQAALALGRPDRIDSRETAQGVQEVWAYGVESAQVGFGFGLGGPGYIGTGVDVAPAPSQGGARLRVTLQNGVVVSVERRRE